MAIIGFDHVNIRTADRAQTVAFLTAVLGLEIGPRPALRSTGAWLYANGNALVHVSDAADGERARATDALGRVDHVAFVCAGYRETIAKLRDLGVATRETDIPERAVRQVFIEGPDVAFELVFTAADVAS